MMSMSATETVRAALNATANGDVDAIRNLYSADCRGWIAGDEITSNEELIEDAKERRGALSEIRVEAEPAELPDGTVAVEWHLTARHTGPLLLDGEHAIEATGRPLDLRGAMFAEVREGRITSFRQYWDQADLLEQLGLLTDEDTA